MALGDAVEVELSRFDCSSEKHPGRVTIRRLNKSEYNNTIRDLAGLKLNLADDFPSDDVGNGFDNIGDVLSIPPILLEKYLGAAEPVAEAVFENPTVRKRVFPIVPNPTRLRRRSRWLAGMLASLLAGRTDDRFVLMRKNDCSKS